MKARTITRLLLAAAVAAAPVACTLDGTIYSFIEKEQKTPDNTLPKDMTVGDIVKAGAGTYYVAAGTLFKGTLSGTMTWTPNASTAQRPFNPGGEMVNSLAWNVAALWGGFLGASGSLGLKSSSLPASPSSWSTEDAAQVAGLWMANGLLFASRAVASGSPATYHYTLWSWNGVAWTASSPTWSVAPAGVAWDGTNYYTAEDGSIFQDPANPPTFAAAAAVTLGSGDAAQGVYGDFANTTPRALVATKKSGIRWTDDFGSTWHTIAAPTVNSVTVSLLSVAGPIDGANGTKYLAGSDGYGYFVFDVAQAKFLARFPAATLTWYSDKVSLSAASIRRILVDDNGTTTTVFMGTHGAGLWRGTFTDATGALAAAWTHE